MYVSMPEYQNPEGGQIRRFAIRWAAKEWIETPDGMAYESVARTDYLAAFTQPEAEALFNLQMHMLYRTGNIKDLLIEEVYDVVKRQEALAVQYAAYEGYNN